MKPFGKKMIRILGFLFLSFGTLSCGGLRDPFPNMAGKRLLSGIYAGSDTDFEYYRLDASDSSSSSDSSTEDILPQDRYAVALKNESLTSVSIPSSYAGGVVTGVWAGGFMGCQATSITIPNTIETIDYEAFMNCASLTVLTVPSSVSTIGESAFYSCTSLRNVRFNNSNESGTSNAALDVCVPEAADEEDLVLSTLATIPSFCFFNCSALETLILPASIEEVGYEAFSGCANLTSTIAFQSIKTIRARAFEGCKRIPRIYIPLAFFPDGVIEPHAFNYCSSSLIISFVSGDASGSTTNFDVWSSNNPNWGYHVDVGANNASNNYGLNASNYTIETGSNYFTEDWQYSVSNGEVTILSYVGNKSSSSNHFISFPNDLPIGTGNKVRFIDRNVFGTDTESVNFKKKIKRIYLPKYLRAIEREMFNGDYEILDVVDYSGSTKCDLSTEDGDQGGSYVKRIDLSALTDLEIIGDKAFLNMKKIGEIQKLHLPYSLIGVGNTAFCEQNDKGLMKVTDFKWDYDDEKSQLEFVGSNTFYKLGLGKSYGGGNLKNNNDNTDIIHRNYKADDDTAVSPKYNYKLTTLIFPRTFKHFGIVSGDYSGKWYSDSNKYFSNSSSTAHVFVGCPLIEKVIFKGDKNDSGKTADLLLPIQTFAFCESLRTVVFEERANHYIMFHTQKGDWSEPVFGYGRNGDKLGAKTDFQGNPQLQTIVLPNVSTYIVVQDWAFAGTSRATMYLSGTKNDRFYWNNTTSAESCMSASFGSLSPKNAVTDATNWRTIGNEDYYNSAANDGKGYFGYCFAPSVNTQTSLYTNSYSLNQQIPIYENVHYEETISDGNSVITTVEVGNASTEKELILDESSSTDGKFAFVLDKTNHKATLSNYLYDRYEATFTGVAKIPSTVSFDNEIYTVNAIGESAFSACFSDGISEVAAYKATHADLSRVILPNTIESIGDYAFLRAYGVSEISTSETAGTYSLPSTLRYIGKNAFTFCNVVKFLNIPEECTFYETEVDTTHKVASCFSNNFSLRQITFADTDGNSSNGLYLTTTYEHSSGVNYTSSLYSKGTSRHPNRLLLILNRDVADKTKATTDEVTISGSPAKNQFSPLPNYRNPFLYGAYNMGYWIDSLVLSGTPTTSSGANGGTNLDQAFFKGVCNRAADGTVTDAYIYLGRAIAQYANQTCDLSSVQLDASNLRILQPFAFDGCEKLVQVNLPYSEGANFPGGVFANNTNTSIIYATPDANHVDGAINTARTIDLTNSGYASIGKELFYNNDAIQTFIAPSRNGFTLGESALASCKNLTTIDLSNVTGTLTIGKGCFEGSCASASSVTINWPTNADIVIEESAFHNLKKLGTLDFSVVTGNIIIKKNAFQASSITGITWPTSPASGKTVDIQEGGFSNCTSLTTLTMPTNLNNQTLGIKAFQGCTSLNNLNLGSSIEKIGHYAFDGCTNLQRGVDGKLIVPSSVFYIGRAAFHKTGLIEAEFQTTGKLAFGRSGGKARGTFGENSSLGKVVFNPACIISYWASDVDDATNMPASIGDLTSSLPGGSDFQFNTFSGCGAIEQVWLPNTFDLGTNHGASFVWESNDSVIMLYQNNIANNQVTTAAWRHTRSSGGNNYANIYFQIDEVSDLLNSGNAASDKNLYWAKVGGVAYLLGTRSSTSNTEISVDSATVTARLFSNDYAVGATDRKLYQLVNDAWIEIGVLDNV